MSSSVQNYSSVRSSESRVLIREELSERIQYNVKDLPEHVLQTGDVSNELVSACVRRLRSEYASDFATLERVTQAKSFKETDMYTPLFRIFRAIEETSRSHDRRHYRHFVKGHSRKVDAEGLLYPDIEPDFYLVETPEPSESSAPMTDIPMRNEAITRTSIKARQICGFIEVKANEKDDCPVPVSEGGRPKEVTAQMADYARLVFTGRPHQLFVIGILIYGMRFCVGYFDRAGALLSEEYHLKDNLDVLVRIIRRLTCDMSANELGHNPNVTLAEGHTYYQESYPRFRIQLGGDDDKVWLTEGSIRWSSLSLFGRGTSVWEAAPLDMATGTTGKAIILKIAWRNENRTPEATIYTLLGHHDGIARCIGGADAYFSKDDEDSVVPLSVDELRKRNVFHGTTGTEVTLGTEVKREHKAVLHLVTLRDVGRPLWEYNDEMEFIDGIKAILGGLEYMASKNICHRDISAGNVYLRDKPKNPASAGFIADVEFASIPPQETVFKVVSTVQNSTTDISFVRTAVPPKSEPGPMMTGTAQFMATEVLQAIRVGRTVVRTVYHDLESLLFVIIYALYRRALSANSPLRQGIAEEFRDYFGGHTVKGILGKRSQIYSQIGLEKLIGAMSVAMKYLLSSFKVLLINQNMTVTYPEEVLRYQKNPDAPFLEDDVVPVPIEFAMVHKRLESAEWYIRQ